jgi:hypothetical protein
MKQYRMAKWVDLQTISNFENHRNDSLCDKWLSPIDDGVKIKWDKPNYLSNDVGVVKVIDNNMNLDEREIDFFDIHVWSDTDHKGIELTVTETSNDSGIFEGTVFFTTADESIGTRLLVEDAVYAEHKSSVNFSRIIAEPEPPTDSDNVCPPGKVLDWDICIDECPIGQIESNGICRAINSDSLYSVPSYFVITVASIFVIIIIVSLFLQIGKKKMKTRLLMISMILPLVTIGHIHAEPLEFTVAKVQWIPDSHSSDGFAAIQVIEPDMNLSPNEIEKFKIRIWSDSDPEGISPDVYETGKDSGVFVSNIYFSPNHSTGQRLHTLEEDLVIASYEDHTLPASYADEKLEILDSVIIRKTLANPDENQSFFRVGDPSFVRQSLQTGETISTTGTFTSIIVSSIGPILIVLFIVIYAVKKRMKKNIEEKK